MDRDTDNTLVLGIDPGLNTSGYGLIRMTADGPQLVEAGVVRSRAHDPLESKLLEIHRGVSELLTAFHPDAVALEQLYSHYERPTTAILMGHARGVICLAAAQAGVAIHHYAATHVKKMLTGSGRAPKPQVQMAICRQFGLAQAPEPPDVADALAIALCHVYFCKSPVKRAL